MKMLKRQPGSYFLQTLNLTVRQAKAINHQVSGAESVIEDCQPYQDELTPDHCFTLQTTTPSIDPLDLLQ